MNKNFAAAPGYPEATGSPRVSSPTGSAPEPLEPVTAPEDPEATLKLPFDPLRLLAALARRTGRILLLALLAGVAAFVVLPKVPSYLATIHLVRRESTIHFTADRQGMPFRPQVLSTATLARYLHSPLLLRQVGAQSQPPTSPADILTRLKLLPLDNPDVISFTLRGDESAQATAQFANLFAQEASRVTQDMQSREAREINSYLKEILATIDLESAQIQEEMNLFLRDSGLFNLEKEADSDLQQRSQVDLNYQNVRIELETADLKIQTLKEEILNQKRGAIDALLVLYTDAHPVVEEERAQLRTLEKQLAEDPQGMLDAGLSSPAASGLFQQIIALRVQKIALTKQLEELGRLRERIQAKLAGLSEKSQDFARINERLRAVQLTRSFLAGRQREAQLFEENPLGYFMPMATIAPEDVAVSSGARKAFFISLVVFGLIAVVLASLVLAAELTDERLKTRGDVARVTQLSVLASLGDLERLDPSERAQWGFRAWTVLSALIYDPSRRRSICGFLASQPGEGISTWIDLLAAAAARRGLRVQRVSARVPAAATAPGAADWLVAPFAQSASAAAPAPWQTPPAGWTWEVAAVNRWIETVKRWESSENLVVLVELPPASDPSATLLAETLPHVLWLTGAGCARASDTQLQVDTLRHTECRLAGAVLNREPQSFKLPTLPRWIRRFALAATLATAMIAQAEDSAVPSAAPADAAPGSEPFFSVVTPEHRAPWQQRLTLGPGDTLNFSLLRFPELSQNNITIGPDGRVSFLQAQGVVASGFTIDELRERLEQILSTYYRSPRVIVTPVAFRSKKYFVLGAIVNRGVYTLDRPLTLIEAVARAQGIATVISSGRTIVESSDLSRSFLIRRGSPASVDFEKLFRQGELGENIPLEPDDYLYFAPATLNEVYLLGQFRVPGIQSFAPGMTLVQAVTAAGGFVPRAYQRKVLIVRGSLRRPEPYTVDAAAILAGKAPDFRLEPKDIIYVSRNPWSTVGQIIDAAIASYLYAVTVTWSAQTFAPIIDHPPYIPVP